MGGLPRVAVFGVAAGVRAFEQGQKQNAPHGWLRGQKVQPVRPLRVERMQVAAALRDGVHLARVLVPALEGEEQAVGERLSQLRVFGEAHEVVHGAADAQPAHLVAAKD